MVYATLLAFPTKVPITVTITSASTLLLAAIAFLLLYWNAKFKSQTHRMLPPPGPEGLPIVGYLPYLGKNIHVTYKKLSDIYGPIIRVKIGLHSVVVLNSLEAIKEGLNKEEVLARPGNFILRALGMQAITTINGKPWLENRRFGVRALRDLGFGKKPMEDRIQNEAADLVDILLKRNGTPGSIEEILVSSVSMNISAFLFGERYGDHEHPKRQFMVKVAIAFIRSTSFAPLVSFFPALQNLLFHIPCTKFWNLSQRLRRFSNFVRKEVQDHLKSDDGSTKRDLIDAYLDKMERNRGEDNEYNMTHLVGNVINLFGAGTNTIRTVLQWHLLNCARDPDGIQRRIQREIDAVIGRHRSPEWEDRLKMPFTMAAIWEMLRWKTLTPLGIVRTVERDTKIGGFDIPAGTTLLANIWAVHHDPTLWERHEEFNPDRFLSADGRKLLPRPAAFIAFSTGRRMCPGEPLAVTAMFLYLTTLLQTFTVLPKTGDTISMDHYEGLIILPERDQELVFLPR